MHGHMLSEREETSAVNENNMKHLLVLLRWGEGIKEGSLKK